VFGSDGTTLLLQKTQTWTQTSPAWWLDDSIYAPRNNSVLSTTTTKLADTGQVSGQTFAYDSYGNLSDTYDYDFGSGAPNSLLRRTHIDYLGTNPVNSINYQSDSIHITGLPSQRWVSSDSAGSAKASLTNYEYDNYTTDSSHAALINRSSVVGFDSTNYSTSNTVRGNVTAVTRYSNAAAPSGAVTSYSQFDILGNMVKIIDPNGNASTLSYADNFGSPDSEATTNSAPSQLNGLNTFAFLTSATNPLAWTSFTQYDYNIGAPVNDQSIDGIISKTVYNDPLERPTQLVSAIGVQERQTTIDYDDANHRVQKTSDLNALNDNLLKSVDYYDGFERTTETRTYEENGNYKAVQIKYDALGRANKQSNPFRPTEINGSHPILWTENRFDALGRVYETESPDGAKSLTSYNGNRTLATDQAGKQRISRTNGLGQLVDVWEITASDSATVSVTFPGTGISHGYQTSYAYDYLGNLIAVTQGSQTRTFTYDHLSRLVSYTNPEAGTISYTYDTNGNLKTRRDARNIKTVSDYDALNRIIKRCYRSIGTGSLGMTTCASNTETQEPNTSDVTYTYENTNITDLKGVLTKVTNELSTTEYTDFDLVGKIKKSKQTTDGTVYNEMQYSYNLAGILIDEIYPSGRKVKNTIDNAGSLTAVQSRKNSTSGYWNYADSFTYSAAGAVTSMQLGNGHWESTLFNNRLQPKEINLGTTSGATNLLKLQYDYGKWESGSLNATKNNGNIGQQIITVPNGGSNLVFTQKYDYDSLNRITDATETGSGGQTWRQAFTYDRYGNRNFGESNTTTLTKSCGTSPNFTVCAADRKKENPSISTSTNRIVQDQDGDSVNDYTFDSSGNTTKLATGMTFIYDGEIRQVEVKNSSSVTIGQYYYDGDGRRVKKYVPETGEKTIFIYDLSGKLVAEYSTVLNPTPQVSYLTTDHLGSPRINTSENGGIISRHDYHPFGEKIATSQRTSGTGYVADDNRKQFTGYERDRETELDFAQARYYNKSFGRFNSPDPLLGSGRVKSAQSWNRYNYVLNNPLNLVDPFGLYTCEGDGDECREFGDALAEAKEKLKGLKEGSKEHRALSRAIEMYGCNSANPNCGDKGKNGVRVFFGNGSALGKTQVAGVAGTKTGANPTGQDIRITLNRKTMAEGGPLATSVVTHEGSHGADASEWVASGFNDSMNPNVYQSERDAFYTNSYYEEANKQVARGSGWTFEDQNSPGGSVTYTTYDRSWKNVDEERLLQVDAIVNHQYGFTPDFTGGQTFTKGAVFKNKNYRPAL